MISNFKAALFDLDGVVFDTEHQYTKFWSSIFGKYYGNPSLAEKIKGSTLVQIYDAFFSGKEREKDREDITAALNRFEADMDYDYIPGFERYVLMLKEKGIKTAVVTSSNIPKMENVYRKKPEFRSYFDAILTSEDFAESKPSPDCYLRAAERLGVPVDSCVVFEDSFNGLKSGRAARMYVVGLATTNSEEAIAPFCNEVIDNYLLEV